MPATPATSRSRVDAPKRPRAKLSEQEYENPVGVQGRNSGYRQAYGATRSGAKRSKRP